jgi:hypothetical protein
MTADAVNANDSTADDSTALRDAFAALADDDPASLSASCPPPERVWEAVAGELGRDEVRAVIGHVAVCAACAEAWRLARELGAGGSAEVASAGRRRWLLPLAAAAVLALAFGIGLRDRPELREGPVPEPSTLRAAPGPAAVRSLVPEDVPLTRDDFLLRWSGPPGARYDLTVIAGDAVVQVQGLEDPEHRLPHEALDDLPAAAQVYWRVEAELPDGGATVSSETFIVRLADDPDQTIQNGGSP